MARIRSIKPEFPQSETVGRLSRDARLLFIMLWTLVDDAGRARAASRMLASLLYPYDDDAPKLMDRWLAELEAEGCIRRYEVDGSRYLEICNWLKHQKIDHPSESKLPSFDEGSQHPREPSRTLAPDLGPRTKDRTKDQEEPNGSLSSPANDECKQAFDAWNQCAASCGLAKATSLNDARRAKLKARLREHGLDGWLRAIGNIPRSPFLIGQGRDGWKASFDFLLQASSFVKVLDGNYLGPDAQAPPDDKPKAPPSDYQGPPTEQIEREAEELLNGQIREHQEPEASGVLREGG